jgi:hypothetical protein
LPARYVGRGAHREGAEPEGHHLDPDQYQGAPGYLVRVTRPKSGGRRG